VVMRRGNLMPITEHQIAASHLDRGLPSGQSGTFVPDAQPHRLPR